MSRVVIASKLAGWIAFSWLCRQQAHTEEARLMELLADEEADEEGIPDDGELEGSGDDFDGW